MSIQTENAVLEPHLTDPGRSGTSYPNPFFDLSQQYAPRTIKELFEWCTFFFYTNPLIGSTIAKISRYPITNLIIDEDDVKVKEQWLTNYNDHIKIKDRMMEVNLDLNVYGNAFVSLHLPFTRMLVCGKCQHKVDIKEVSWKWKNWKFSYTCPSCKEPAEGDPKDQKSIVDIPYRSIEEIKVIRWNPENITIKYNEATGRSVYYYCPSSALRNQVTQGDEDILEDIPLLFIRAIKESRTIKLSSPNIFHLKRPTLAEKDMGWGKPLIYQVLKDTYYYYTLRRAQEAIANEHIVPFDFLYPQPNAQMDPFVHTDLGNWRSQVEDQVKKHKADPNHKAIIPVPIGVGRIGGDGKVLMITPELNYLNQTIVGGMGIPSEFLFGGLNWCLAPDHNLLTSEGMLKLEEICPEEIGFECPSRTIEVSSKEGIERIAFVHRTERKERYSIKTNIGLSLAGSSIHRVWVLEKDLTMKWKNLEEIKPGDYVAFPKKTDLWGKENPSKELCRILGYLVSEGSVTQKEVSFSNTDYRLIEDFCSCMKSLLGVENKIESRFFSDDSGHYGKKEVHSVRYKAEDIINYFGNLMGFGYAKDKKVPALIRKSKKECVFEFLKSLFEGDGCNYISSNKKQTISYNSISETLLEEVQLLLLNAGIVSTLYDELDVPAIQIRSEFAEIFMNEIGFVTKNKTDENCNPEKFRCKFSKYPFLLGHLKKLKKLTKGDGAWVTEKKDLNLTEEIYTTKEVADLLDRDPSSVSLYIKNGKLKAKKESRRDGRFCSYQIRKEDLEEFIDLHGTSKRASIGQTTWEINENNEEYVNWNTVKELDPILYKKFQDLKKANFYWDEVTTVSLSNKAIEMCDLTIFNTHSYVANGLISHNTGSSVTLRSLQNDFLHNQTQMIDLVNWLTKKIGLFLRCRPPKKVRFLDFKMADDVQKIQQMIGLNAARKISDDTLLTELGLDYEKEKKKIVDEIQDQNEIQDIIARAQAKTSGESQIIQYNYQEKLEELKRKSIKKMQARGEDPSGAGYIDSEQSMVPQGEEVNRAQMTPDEAVDQPGYQDQQNQEIPGASPAVSSGGENSYLDVHKMVKSWATKLSKMEPTDQAKMLMQIKQQMPSFGDLVEKTLNEMLAKGEVGVSAEAMRASGQAPSSEGVSMKALPEQRAPRRKGEV
jgi:intein/homing endonuclease